VIAAIPPVLAAAFQLQATPPPQADTSLFPARGEMIRLYTDCYEARWPYDTAEAFVPKSTEELLAGVARRRELEARWSAYFIELAGDSIAATPPESWAYPLAVAGRLLNNYADPREGSPHEALDIFVSREGAVIRSPVSGVVVASGDGWLGGWRRRGRRGGELWYQGGGLSRRAGNGVLIFDPASGGYLYLIHMQSGVLVSAGDVVRRGQEIGRVGHSGNASEPGRGRHLHLAYKRVGDACGVAGVLVPENPYPWIRAARRRLPS
jgi:murein DD-endopeptidase MepM/ murein hydrolase activator NlpD